MALWVWCRSCLGRCAKSRNWSTEEKMFAVWLDELSKTGKAMDYCRSSFETEVTEAVVPVHSWDELQK